MNHQDVNTHNRSGTLKALYAPRDYESSTSDVVLGHSLCKEIIGLFTEEIITFVVTWQVVTGGSGDLCIL